MTPDEVHNVRFRKPPIGKRGYDEADVDDLLDRIERTLRGQSAVTREELDAPMLRKPSIGKRGYNKDEVDGFLQRVRAELPV